MGRRGSPWAHTLGKWSHGPQDHFRVPPGPRNLIFNIKFAGWRHERRPSILISNLGIGGTRRQPLKFHTPDRLPWRLILLGHGIIPRTVVRDSNPAEVCVCTCVLGMGPEFGTPMPPEYVIPLPPKFRKFIFCLFCKINDLRVYTVKQ